MQETVNLKLKKIELTDSPPDITVINPNWDKLDEEITGLDKQIEVLNNERGYKTSKLITNISQVIGNGKYYFTALEAPLEGVYVLDVNNFGATNNWSGFAYRFYTNKLYHVSMVDGSLTVKELATTEKTEILCTPGTGITIVNQYNYQINNVCYYTIRIAPSDGGKFPAGYNNNGAIKFPTGKVPYATVFTAYGLNGSSWTNEIQCTISTTSGALLNIPTATSDQILISGVIVL